MTTHKDHACLPTPTSPSNDNNLYIVEIDIDGTQFWRTFANTEYSETCLHRLDGPAIIFKATANGDQGQQIWCKDGVKHRDATQVKANRPTYYPAVIHTGGYCLEYWQEGKLHCTVGPAIMTLNYPQENLWYLEGKNMSYEAWYREVQRRQRQADLIASAPQPQDGAGTHRHCGRKIL